MPVISNTGLIFSDENVTLFSYWQITLDVTSIIIWPILFLPPYAHMHNTLVNILHGIHWRSGKYSNNLYSYYYYWLTVSEERDGYGVASKSLSRFTCTRVKAPWKCDTKATKAFMMETIICFLVHHIYKTVVVGVCVVLTAVYGKGWRRILWNFVRILEEGPPSEMALYTMDRPESIIVTVTLLCCIWRRRLLLVLLLLLFMAS